jgi:hypothetical protein
MEKLEDETLRAIAGPDMTVLRTPVALVGRDLTHVGEFTVAAGEAVPFVLSYGPSHLPPPAVTRRSGGARCDRGVLERMGGEVPARGPLVTGRGAIGDDPEGTDLCVHGRHCGGPDHFAAGAARRLAQLGLPLLLAAGRHVHAARNHERRLLRRSASVARLAGPGGRRQPAAGADSLWHRG